MTTAMPLAVETGAEPRGWILPINAITTSADGVLVIKSPPPTSKHQFVYEGVRMHVFLESKGEEDCVCRIWADVCRLPYTAEAPTARKIVLEIMRQSKPADPVRFVIDKKQRVLAIYENEMGGKPTLDLLMMEILAFLNRSVPYIELFRQKAPID